MLHVPVYGNRYILFQIINIRDIHIVTKMKISIEIRAFNLGSWDKPMIQSMDHTSNKRNHLKNGMWANFTPKQSKKNQIIYKMNQTPVNRIHVEAIFILFLFWIWYSFGGLWNNQIIQKMDQISSKSHHNRPIKSQIVNKIIINHKMLNRSQIVS